MTLPLTLVTGFLGAGKTTFINDLLLADHGQRIAAIVNDFGAINIDAELLAGAADAVVGLQNGCICCSLQGDLLRSLRLILAHQPPPERIVIEASGAADPRGILEVVLDPMLWSSISLDAVLCLVDAQDLADSPERAADPLWRAQVQHSDFAVLSKTAGLPPDALMALRAQLAPFRKQVVDLADAVPLALLCDPGADMVRASPAAGRVGAGRFSTVEWRHPGPLSQPRFQQALQQIAPGLLRAKGYVEFAERPGQVYLLQLVGRRASFRPVATPAEPGCRLVLIAEAAAFDPDAARAALDTTRQVLK